MSENPYTYLKQEGKPELWPQELWQLIIILLQRVQESGNNSLVHIKSKRCPNYTSALGDNHEDFNQGLRALSTHKVLYVEWLSNGAVAKWIRLTPGQQGLLEQLVNEFSPLKAKLKRQLSDQDQERENLEMVIAQYGSLGQRTVAHLGFGDSHYFDGRQLNTNNNERFWVQADAKVEGANLVRVAGELTLETPAASFRTTWERPGHYLWEWDIARCFVDSLKVGKKLLLIENPYPYWELLSICQNSSITLACLHGETLWDHQTKLDHTLAIFLQKVYKSAPGLDTWIWCDPDPSGLLIASNAYKLVQTLGGSPRFWMMGADILSRIEALVLGQNKLKPATEKDMQLLLISTIHSELQPLANEIKSRGLKGEQEGLILDPILLEQLH
jgi:hypothetical protein